MYAYRQRPSFYRPREAAASLPVTFQQIKTKDPRAVVVAVVAGVVDSGYAGCGG